MAAFRGQIICEQKRLLLNIQSRLRIQEHCPFTHARINAARPSFHGCCAPRRKHADETVTVIGILQSKGKSTLVVEWRFVWTDIASIVFAHVKPTRSKENSRNANTAALSCNLPQCFKRLMA